MKYTIVGERKSGSDHYDIAHFIEVNILMTPAIIRKIDCVKQRKYFWQRNDTSSLLENKK